MFGVLLVVLPFVHGNLDPECYMTVPEIAKYYGYPSETHIVRTEDEYLLELHRIPRGKNEPASEGPSKKPIVFMQHGLLADGFNFLGNLPEQSAATVFADQGCDVWVSNSRGTPASQKHIGYGPEDQRFWNFTWQEMSHYDLVASVKYVLKETSATGLYYVGHSQGTVIMFAALSEDQQLASKIYQFHALAPVATVSHIGGLFRLLGSRTLGVLDFLLNRAPYQPLAIPKFIQKILSKFCSIPLIQNVCTLDIGILDGRESMINTSRVGTIGCHMPAATSLKDLQHWIQVVKSRKFEKFDYGPDGNLMEYGTNTPPEYDLSKINASTYLYWSKDDILADTEDIRETILAKMNKSISASIELPHYTHIDFVLGLNATVDVYLPIVKEIQKDFNLRKKEKYAKFMQRH